MGTEILTGVGVALVVAIIGMLGRSTWKNRKTIRAFARRRRWISDVYVYVIVFNGENYWYLSAKERDASDILWRLRDTIESKDVPPRRMDMAGDGPVVDIRMFTSEHPYLTPVEQVPHIVKILHGKRIRVAQIHHEPFGPDDDVDLIK
ncbi:hypothetical protein [Isoptericola sp. NPDC057559]|uniref:hypothetical protein n=1 Tax=Isoptericola sp. NPDC057559 TaxID=3346168 RepID=UPI003687A255